MDSTTEFLDCAWHEPLKETSSPGIRHAKFSGRIDVDVSARESFEFIMGRGRVSFGPEAAATLLISLLRPFLVDPIWIPRTREQILSSALAGAVAKEFAVEKLLSYRVLREQDQSLRVGGEHRGSVKTLLDNGILGGLVREVHREILGKFPVEPGHER